MNARCRGPGSRAVVVAALLFARVPSVHAEPTPKAAPSASYGPPAVGDLPPPAPPKSLAETLTGRAKDDYAAALLLYGSGDLRSAALRFQSAYDSSQDVRLLWNAAACEQGMRHYAKAIALVRRYLASGSPLITAEAERTAQVFLEAAIPLTARLIITASEPGATVFVDDEPVGTLPLDEPPRVDFGTRRLSVEKRGFVSFVRNVTVTSSTDVKVDAVLTARVHRGRVVVRAGKQDSIFLDGRFVGLGIFVNAVSSGKHVLRVTADGARPFEASILVEDDRTRAMDVTLQRDSVAGRLPTWLWVAGGAVVAAGATTAGYFMLRSSDDSDGYTGTMADVRLPLR